MAHATHDWTREVIRRIRTVIAPPRPRDRDHDGHQGPGDPHRRPRRAHRAQGRRDLRLHRQARRTRAKAAEEVRSVDVNYQDLVNDINVGDTVLVDNGLIRLEVLEKHDAHIRCRVLIPGQLTSRRHINLPGVKVNLPAFTEKDRGRHHRRP